MRYLKCNTLIYRWQVLLIFKLFDSSMHVYSEFWSFSPIIILSQAPPPPLPNKPPSYFHVSECVSVHDCVCVHMSVCQCVHECVCRVYDCVCVCE